MFTQAKKLSPTRLGILGAAAVLGATAAAGCQKDHDASGAAPAANMHGEAFPADGETRPAQRFIQVQTANAARADATLTPAHFDGRGGLNSLGRQKLDDMLKGGSSASPLVIYLDLSRDAASARAAGTTTAPASPEAHRDSVRLYLADRGVSDAQFELRSGPNLGYNHPARDGLRGLHRLDEDDAAGDSANGSGAAKTGSLGSGQLLSPAGSGMK